jgi:hypothetical protein
MRMVRGSKKSENAVQDCFTTVLNPGSHTTGRFEMYTQNTMRRPPQGKDYICSPCKDRATNVVCVAGHYLIHLNGKTHLQVL